MDENKIVDLPKPSRTLPVDNSMVRRPGFRLFVFGISMTAGGEVVGDVWDSGWFNVLLLMFTCTLSVVRTAAGLSGGCESRTNV